MKTRKEDRKSKISRKRKSSLLGRAAAAGTVIGATFAAHGNTVYAQEMESESAADSESDYTANAQASESEAESVSPESENEAEAQPQSEAEAQQRPRQIEQQGDDHKIGKDPDRNDHRLDAL